MKVYLSSIIDFVHQKGRWQSEECYETKVEEITGGLIVYNANTYGTQEEREICHDSVMLDLKDGMLKINSVDIWQIDIYYLKTYPFIFNKDYYESYLICMDEAVADENKYVQIDLFEGE